MISEVKSRISNSIITKLEKHSDFICEKGCGYILTVSYGNLPRIDFYHAVQTIYPFGDLTLEITKNVEGRPVINDQYFNSQYYYIKPSPRAAPIETYIFGNPKYNWVSTVLFSSLEVSLLLKEMENLPYINWHGQKNDFVLVHNPTAQYPLLLDPFSSATKIKIQNKFVSEGKNIFSVL